MDAKFLVKQFSIFTMLPLADRRLRQPFPCRLHIWTRYISKECMRLTVINVHCNWNGKMCKISISKHIGKIRFSSRRRSLSEFPKRPTDWQKMIGWLLCSTACIHVQDLRKNERTTTTSRSRWRELCPNQIRNSLTHSCTPIIILYRECGSMCALQS